MKQIQIKISDKALAGLIRALRYENSKLSGDMPKRKKLELQKFIENFVNGVGKELDKNMDNRIYFSTGSEFVM